MRKRQRAERIRPGRVTVRTSSCVRAHGDWLRAGECAKSPADWALSPNRHKRILGTVAAPSHGFRAESATPSLVLSGPSLSLGCPSRRQHTIGLAEILRSAAFPGSAGFGRPGRLPRVASMSPAGPPFLSFWARGPTPATRNDVSACSQSVCHASCCSDGSARGPRRRFGGTDRCA